jgi:RNA polymerase sigma-70 factor (ECF subfamily)
MPADAHPANDAALLALAQGGDAAALDALVRRHYRAAYLVALAAVGSRSDAEDVCHDGLVRAIERLGTCREADRFGAWLARVVRNVAHNHRAYHKVRAAEPLHDDLHARGDDTSRLAETGEVRDRLEAALRTIPERQREVVLLHDLEGWQHREIAELMNVSETMSRQLLFVARRTLRQKLGLTLGNGGEP